MNEYSISHDVQHVQAAISRLWVFSDIMIILYHLSHSPQTVNNKTKDGIHFVCNPFSLFGFLFVSILQFQCNWRLVSILCVVIAAGNIED